MSCANETCSPLIALPRPASADWQPPRVLTAIGLVVVAFREALALRRAAHRIEPFVDA
jgi:hypothetical protein